MSPVSGNGANLEEEDRHSPMTPFPICITEAYNGQYMANKASYRWDEANISLGKTHVGDINRKQVDRASYSLGETNNCRNTHESEIAKRKNTS